MDKRHTLHVYFVTVFVCKVYCNAHKLKTNRVIYYVMCTKQTKTRGVKVKDLCTIPLKSIDMMFLTPAPG